ncbi:MAG TPA: HAD family hydrolase [Opitutaceae bacterium]|nr:HAD family hydrolase [Opitutaceae bacterium]
MHTVVFDLDDTLFAEEQFVRSGFRAVDAWLKEKRGVAGFAQEAERLFAIGRRGKIFDEALLALKQPADPELIVQLVRQYRDHQPTLKLFEDAYEILEWVDGRFRLALLADGFHATQARKIEALGLRTRIPVQILTDALGREFWKPHPQGFLRIMAELPGEQSGYLYVADNPRKDFVAPRQLGWKTVRIRRTSGEHRDYEPGATEAPDAEIGSLIHLKSLIRPILD